MRFSAFARLVGLVAFAVLAGAPSAPAMILVTAPAVHTSAVGTGARAHRVLHRHARHHHGYRAHLRRRAGAPETPAPRPRSSHRPERRAALPSTPRARRHQNSSRFGPAMLAPIAGHLAILGAGCLDELQRWPIRSRAGRVISGRGPPRGDRLASSMHPSPSGLIPARRSSVAPARNSVPPRSSGLTARADAADPQFDHVLPFPFIPSEPVSGRSPVRRPEGATACMTMPSCGEAE
jgi:hypothetical protein